MPPSDSSEIDAALVTALQNDATLKSLLPDGVYMDEGPPGAKKFAVCGILDSHDEGEFGQRAIEDVLYFVKAVALSTAGVNMKSAAARIDEILENAALTVPGYGFLDCARERRIRETEVDKIDASIRWYHRGGVYRVRATPLAPQQLHTV